MLKSSIVPVKLVIEKASKDLNYDHTLLSNIVLHQFYFIKEFQKNPTSCRLHLLQFGMFVIPRWKFYDVLIGKVIVGFRLDRSEEMFKILRRFLSMRFMVNDYYRYQEYKSKKRNGLYEKVTSKAGGIDDAWDISGESSNANT